MSVFQAIILGIVQGLTEFLPVSSSGHLVILPLLFGWQEQPLVFDTTLHLGTASALLLYFWSDLFNVFTSFIKDFLHRKMQIKNYSDYGYMGILIIVGSIPAGILGFLFEDIFESYFRGLFTVSLFLVIGSILMWLAEKIGKQNKERFDIKDSLLIGLFQALALFPGVSRSGATISGGLLRNVSLEKAARFSFLLSVPIVTLAGIYKLVTSINEVSQLSLVVLMVGFISSTVSGLLAIKWMLSFVRKSGLKVFIVYRLVLAFILFLVALV